MSDAEIRLQKIKDQNKARAQRYYEAHKTEVAARRKQARESCKQAMTEVQPKQSEKQKEVEKKQLKTLKGVIAELKANNLTSVDINNTNQLFDILDIVDFEKAFKNSKHVIYKIETATQKHDSSKLYSINSKKSMYQTIIKYKDILDMTMSDKSYNAYKDKYNEFKIESSEQSKQKAENEEVLDFNDYLKLVENAYGQVSKQFIIACLYRESGFRDDLQLLVIPSETPKTKKQMDTNFIVVPTAKSTNCTIILNTYKTEKKYGHKNISIDRTLSKLIREYIDENDIDYGEYLFGSKKLSKFISNFNAKMGLKITINKLRQMKISKNLAGDKSAKQRVKVAKEMNHAPLTSNVYLRKVKKGTQEIEV